MAFLSNDAPAQIIRNSLRQNRTMPLLLRARRIPPYPDTPSPLRLGLVRFCSKRGRSIFEMGSSDF